MLTHAKAFGSFSVDSLEAAKAFYTNTLGLTVAETTTGFLEIYTAGNHPIVLYEKPHHQPATFTLLNFQVEDIYKAVASLKASGVVFEEYQDIIETDTQGVYDDGYGHRAAWFKDPAGNVLALIQESKVPYLRLPTK